MNDLLFVIWKMTQGWDCQTKTTIVGGMQEDNLHDGRIIRDKISYQLGMSAAGQQIRELLTAAGYRHKEG